jgi:colanic acid/amylovoran biosynthesis glycosyltransferase
MNSDQPIRIAYLFISFPEISQVFLEREIEGLIQRGFEIEVHTLLPSFKRPNKTFPKGIEFYPLRWVEVFKILWNLPFELFRNPDSFRKAWKVFRREPPRNFQDWKMLYLGIFFAFSHINYFRNQKIDGVHGAWATAPATAAMLIHHFCKIPFSFGAHAYDIYRYGGDCFLKTKLENASFVHTTTLENVTHLQTKVNSAKIVFSRRGIQRLPVVTSRNPKRNIFRILSVSRMIRKKGHLSQLKALHSLAQKNIDVELEWIGSGPLEKCLRNEISKLGLEKHVLMRGALSEADVSKSYREANLFWFTGIVDSDGDRDGLPNVIPEALSFKIPVIAFDLPSIREVIGNGVNGLIIPPAAEELAKATIQLIPNEELQSQLGNAGYQWVEKHFLIAQNIIPLASAFQNNNKKPITVSS